MTPSRPPDRDLLSASDAAAYMEISATRLRAMVDEGKIAAVPVGDRFSAYPRAELDRFRAQRDGQKVTPVAALLDTPEQPLRRVHDRVIAAPTSFLPGRIHVRIWEGPDGPRGQRTVVLVSGLSDEISPGHSHWEGIAAAVDHQLLGGSGIDACWFSISATGEADLVNVVQYQAKPAGRVRGWFSPRQDEPAADGELIHPQFRPSDWRELERVVGERVEFYAEKAHTEDAIHRWQRAGHTVDVVDDSTVQLGPLCEALQVMHRIRANDRHAPLARRAAVELASAIKERREWLDTWPWDDGTKFPGGQDAARLPTLFAARLVRPTLTREQVELVDQHSPEPEPWPWSSQYLQDYDALLDGLRRWHEEVDEFADNPDGRTDDAVMAAVGLVRHWSKTAHWKESGDPRWRGRPYPEASPRTAWACGETDRRYVESLQWEPGDAPETRDHRRLKAEISQGTEVRFGRDAFGNLVGVVAHERRPGFDAFAQLVALWPHTPPTRGLPPGSLFTADDGPGPRPVYIQYPDGRLDLLPVPSGSVHDQWHFGYAGGGPGMLRAAITRTVADVDGIDTESVPYHWLSDAIDHSDRERLSINVDDIRRRLTPSDRT